MLLLRVLLVAQEWHHLLLDHLSLGLVVAVVVGVSQPVLVVLVVAVMVVLMVFHHRLEQQTRVVAVVGVTIKLVLLVATVVQGLLFSVT
jgi:hypothetical protein